ncbi:MAG: hypothetical protein GY847_18970 [Proteobacteria bacterium]|nr:hypothetical protein [Pseudomonadota bacterium]
MARRFGIFLLVLLATSGLAVGGLLIWATSETGSQFISGKLRTQLRRDIGLDMSFSDVDLDILPPRIRVNSIMAADEKGRVKCSIEEAEFAPRPLDLLRGHLSIEEVYLGSPRCDVKLGKEEIDVLSDLMRKKDKDSAIAGLDLSELPDFDVFAVSSCDMKLDIIDKDRLGSLHFTMKGLGVDVTGGEPGIEVRGLIEHARANWSRGEDKADESLEGFQFRAAVTENAVDIRHLNAIVAGINIRLRDAHVPVPLWPKGPDVADFSVSVPLELFGRLPLNLPPMSGTAGFLGQVSLGEESKDKVNVSARGRVNLDSVTVDEFVVGDLDGLVSLTPQGVVFSETEMQTADGRLRLSGNIAFDEQLTTEVDAFLDGIELAHLLEQLTVSGSHVTQKMTGPIKVKGRLKPLRLDGMTRIEVIDHTTLLDSFRASNPPVALYIPRTSVHGKVTVTDHYVKGSDLVAFTDNTRVAVDLHINYDDSTWRLLAQSKDFHMEDVKQIAGFEMEGHGPVKCLITGLLTDPKIKGSVALQKFAFEGLHFDRITTDVNFYDSVLSFDGLALRRGQSRISVNELVLDYNAPGGLNITTKIEAEQVEIDDLASTFHIDTRPYGSPKGLLFGRVTIDYDLHPEHLHVDADLVHDKLEIFGERFGTDVLRLDWDGGNLTVSEFGLTKGRGTISITGAMRADQTINFIGVASSISSEAVDNPAFKKFGIRTTGQAFVVAEGTLDNPKGWADIRLGDSVHNGIRYGPTTIDARLDSHIITSRGKIFGNAANMEHLVVDLQTDRFAVEGFIYDVNLVPILNLDTGGHRASLGITGEMALKGSLKGKPNLSGHATMDKVHIAVNDFAFENKRPLYIRAKKSRFRIKRTRFSGPDVVFDVKGMLGLDSLNLEVKGLADLRSASDLIGGVEKSGGTLNFEIAARGKYSAPSLRGQAEVEGGTLKIRNFPHLIEHIRGQVILSPKIVRFVDFTARCAQGGLGASGEMRLLDGEISDYKFRLNMKDLELALMEDLAFTASTVKDGLILKAPQKGGLPKVFGDVEIRNLRYTQNIRVLDLSDIDMDRFTGTRIKATKPKIIDVKNDFFAFDVRLHGHQNLQARNNLFDADLVIDDVEKPLRLIGTNQTFGFMGRVLGKQGQVRFAGKRFDIKYAAVDFRDPTRPDNPHFLVTADGQVRDWKVTMTAEGTVEEYELKFASQPYLSRDDIVFVILTGLTKSEHRQFGSSGISLGSPILGQLGPTGDAIPLEFRVYSEYSEKAGTETTRIALGRWVTPDVWVSVSSSVDQESEVEANLDYKINDRFSISADYKDDNEGNIGNVGVDLKFRLEF